MRQQSNFTGLSPNHSLYDIIKKYIFLKICGGVDSLNLIITHDHVDFDALAAAVGAAKIYPGGLIALPEPLHANVRAFVNLHRDLLPLWERQDGRSVDPPQIAVVVDTRQKRRLGPYLDLVQQAEKIQSMTTTRPVRMT